MNRKIIREFTHKVSSKLTVDSEAYKQWIFRYTFLELEKDLGIKGDITSNNLFSQKKRGETVVLAKDKGILAGQEEINYFLKDSCSSFRPKLNESFVLNWKINDGESFNKGDVICNIEGEIHDLLAVERVVLNLLMRMSSVATYTNKLVDKIKDFDVLLTPTRKTLWGLLDKKAVLIGGGGTHRLGLFDSVLIKDNHIALFDGKIEDLLNIFIKKSNDLDFRFIEIEVGSLKKAMEICKIFNKYQDNGLLKSIPVLLLDNISFKDIEEIIQKVKKEDLYNNILFEASGGIKEDNLINYAKTGVDIISMGALTSNSCLLDMSMKI